MILDRIKPYVVPSVLALAAPVISLMGLMEKIDQWPAFSLLMGGAAYVLMPLAAFLAFRLNQTRIGIYLALLFLGYVVLDTIGPPRFLSPSLGMRVDWVLLLAVAGLPLSFVLPESKLIGRETVVRTLITMAPAAIYLLVANASKSAIVSFAQWPVLFSGTPWFLSGPLFWVTAVCVAVALIGIGERNNRSFREYAVFAWVPLLFAMNRMMEPGVVQSIFRPELHLGAGFSSLLFLSGIFQLYWQKVYLDELTGVPNRRALDEKLRALPKEYALAMIDIDHFKNFNDSYGHEQGDHVLRYVAVHFDHESKGKVYRYGGEEFCIIFPNEHTEDVIPKLERMRKKLEKRKFIIRRKNEERSSTAWWHRGKPAARGKRVGVTVSIGVSGPNGSRRTPDDVIKAADGCLYDAKRKGRNRVEIAA